MALEIDETQFDAAIEAVVGELHGLLRKDATKDAPAEESSGSEGPSSPVPSEGSPGEESASPDAPPAEASAPAGEIPGEAPEASPADPAASPDATMAPPSLEELQAAYAAEPIESLKMHFLACQAALQAKMGQDPAAGAAPAPGPEASSPPPGAAPAPASTPMAMAERKGKQHPGSEGSGGEVSMGKSEHAEIEQLKKQLAERDAAVTKQLAALDGLVGAMQRPSRKSVKGVSDLKFIAKSEPEVAPRSESLSKKEITEVLKDRIRKGDLSPRDKDLVTAYTIGTIDASKIEHLLGK